MGACLLSTRAAGGPARRALPRPPPREGHNSARSAPGSRPTPAPLTGQAEAAIKVTDAMIHEHTVMTGREAKPPPPGPAPEPEIDLERLVWDPEYREIMRGRLKRLG